ncbi:hypothetical protein MDAP_002204 [Mitosporidium daphniae]|uniref:DUF221-domain-containing protein n=1 Tax=Mitosporidium daphniae TaxID=1485682 RepID=A0A098VW73_9MICR|nr:uncharacterized protein DI09_105p50 [Mitosporidium daphniae]KGG53192.1 hypothetical protein DI09_105p50 [Mitosporidium daphniae]|eukprot:XP_013239628.1 uncharacterized protein DI09_105p50 [Mitosporidium daphniae]
MSSSSEKGGEHDSAPVIPDNLDATIVYNAFYAIALSLIFLVVFLFFRRKLKWVYRPNTATFGRYHPLLPEAKSGLASWAWIRHTFFLPDARLLTLVGMDAFILIMILKMLFWTFLLLSIIASIILLPVYMHGTYGAQVTTTSTQIYSRLSIAHLESGSPWLWMPTLAVWLFSLIFGYALILFYSAYVHLRQAYIASPASLTSVLDLIAFYRVTGSLEQTYGLLDIPSRTVLVQGLDSRRFTSEESVTAFFDQCSVGLVIESAFIKDHPRLRHLIRERNIVLRKLESACVLWMHAILHAARRQIAISDAPQAPSSNEPVPEALKQKEVLKLIHQLITIEEGKDNDKLLGSSLALSLPPLTPARKRALLEVSFDANFLSELRPLIGKSLWAKLAEKIGFKGKEKNLGSQESDLERGSGSSSRGSSTRDLISSLGAKLAAIDHLIEAERLSIFSESRALLSESSLETAQKDLQAEALQLPKGMLVNDTRLLLVQASSSTPPQSCVATSDESDRQDLKNSKCQEEEATPPSISAAMEHHKRAPGLADERATFFSKKLFGEVLNDARLAMPKQTRSAFVTFREATAASIISQVLIDGTPFSCRTELAPRPNEIMWGNIGLPAFLRGIRSWSGYAAIILLNLTWFFPVTFVNSLNQINRIAQVVPGLNWVLHLPRPIQTLIEGLLAPLLLNGLLVIVPYALDAISRYEGVPTKTALQRSLMRKYLAFLYLQTFFVSFLSGSILAAIVPFIEDGNFSKIVEEIRQMLVPKSSFFFNLIAIKVANDLFLTLANPVGLFFFISLGALSGGGSGHSTTSLKTPRERQEGRSPERLNYGIVIPLLLFSVPLILTYAVISPLMLGIGTIYYGIAYLVYRYRFLYTARSTWESGGSFLFDVAGFLCLGMATFQVMTAIQLSFQGAKLQALAVMPTLVFTIIIWRLIRRITRTASSYVPAGARPDLAPAARYPEYKRSIPRLHARDALSLGAMLGGRSTLDLVAVLISRQKSFLAEVEVGPCDELGAESSSSGSSSATSSGCELLRPTCSSEVVSLPESTVSSENGKLSSKSSTLAGSESAMGSSSRPSVSFALSGGSSSIDRDLRETVEWYMSNPYRNPTLFKKLNSLYLPRTFFKIIQIVSMGGASSDVKAADDQQDDGDDGHDKMVEDDKENFNDDEEVDLTPFVPLNAPVGSRSSDAFSQMKDGQQSTNGASTSSATKKDNQTQDDDHNMMPLDSLQQMTGSRQPKNAYHEVEPTMHGSPSLSLKATEGGIAPSMTFMDGSSPLPPPIIRFSKP